MFITITSLVKQLIKNKRNMKKLIFLFAAVLIMCSCEKNDDKVVQPVAPKFSIVLKAKTSYLKTALTNDQVVEQAYVVQLSKNTDIEITKNLETKEIILPSTLVLKADGTLNEWFFAQEDMVVLDKNRKVIAYVMNGSFRVGEESIRRCFAKGALDSCDYYLKELYRTIPIDDADWKNLESKNMN